MHARESVKWRGRETREARVVIACLGRFARRTKKKERLVVVYPYFEPYTEQDAMPKPFFIKQETE